MDILNRSMEEAGVNYTTGGIEVGTKTTTAIVAVKQEIRLQEWAAQIEAQQESGKTVQQWCIENGIKEKTYYYRLRRVREQCVGSAPAVVSVPVLQQCGDVRIEKNGVQIYLSADISPETLIAVIHEIC